MAGRRTGAGGALQVCVALGGCAALSWEVLWQIRSSLALGVSARGTAITLATTMVGMGVGSLLAGRLLARAAPRRPLRLYGLLEACIGVAGLCLPAGFAALERLDGWVYRIEPALASGAHALGIALLLGPPTLAMGATVPVFSLLSRGFGVPLSRLYALNTAGAAAGVLVFTFAVVPALGLWRTLLTVAALNLGVCVVAFALREPGAGGEQEHAPTPTPTAAVPSRWPPGAAAGLAAVTGFVTFGLEVAWFRSLRATYQSSTDSFAIILAAVLVPLAVGARLAPWLRRSGFSPPGLLAAAGVAILCVTPVVERMDLLGTGMHQLPGASGYVYEQLGRFGLAFAVLGPPILLIGTVLPWLLDASGTPEQAGRLYGANTVGAALGSLTAAWLLLPAIGAARCAWGLGVLTGVAAAAVAEGGRRRRTIAAAGAAALALAVATSSSVGRDRVQTRYDWPSYRILSFEEGPDSTVSVVEAEGSRYLLIDGFAASGEHTDWGDYMDRMGRLPMRVHPDPRRALVIGFGTGQTAHAVRDEAAERVQIAELDRAVLEAAPHFETNRGVLDDPVVSAAVMDGRAWLRRTDGRYDVITLEPMPPHFAGVNALYSQEFYRILATRLEPGGIACQWVPLHLLPPFYAASVARTFQSVFPEAEMWVVPNAQGILLGRAPGGDARGPLQLRHASEALREETGLRIRARGLERYGAEGGLITDDNQLLAYGRLAADIRLYGSQRDVIQRNLDRVRRIAAAFQD